MGNCYCCSYYDQDVKKCLNPLISFEVNEKEPDWHWQGCWLWEDAEEDNTDGE